MAAEQWEVEQVFAAAVELPNEEGDAYVERVCAGQPELQAEVASLLRAHRGSSSFLEGSLLDAAPMPESIGPYRLLEPLGQGGMGTVYRAERVDGQFQQVVAVKVLSLAGRIGMHKRFADERQILANLSHPFIARLLDGGVTGSGVPYIVMELVDGAPLDLHCAKLTVAQRVPLFRQICAAVHYAHQNLVVHRDLKPANILVIADGSPKLLDFGIAKILTPDVPQGSTWMPAMTPEYASPEQARGEQVTTASDVYSLGVVLHEILTGRRPYALAGKTHGEIIRILSEQPVDGPRSGSADLDAIILKALRKQPAERYSSAEALSADLEHYLEQRPVGARRGAKWYVFSKFVARHRVPVFAASIVAMVLAIAVGAVIRQSRIAQRRFDDVRRLASSSIFQIHDAVAQLPGSIAARKMIVTNALEALDRLSRDSQGDSALQLELAEAYLRLGDLQGFQAQANLGDAEGALASYEKARALFRDVAGREPGSRRAERGMLRASRTQSAVLSYLRRAEQSRAVAREAVALAEARRLRAPGEESDQDVAAAYSSLADVAEDGVPHRLKSLELFEALLAAGPSDPSRRRNVALAHKYLAGRYLPRSHGAQALPHLTRAEELDAARVEADPGDREAQLDLSFDYSQNGTYYLNREQYEHALAQYRKALTIRQKLAAADPLDARLRDRMVFLYRMTGMALGLLNRDTEALAAYREGLRLSESLAAMHPNHPQYRGNLTLAHLGIAETGLKMGQRSMACSAWRDALTVYRKLDAEGGVMPAERRVLEGGKARFDTACR